jgi:hypothetical protein
MTLTELGFLAGHPIAHDSMPAILVRGMYDDFHFLAIERDTRRH